MKAILPAFLSCQGLRLNDDEKRLFAQYNPLGVCLFSKFCANIQSREQVKLLVDDIKNAVGRDNVLIAVDQEGGRVRRLIEPEFTPITSQQNITSTELAKQHAYLVSHDLQECGINVNFAPVLDIMTDKTSDVLRGRCFENNIAELGRAMVDEYINNGICPCVKHLPGHGKAATDPHLALPLIEEDLSQLQTDFAPFKSLQDAPMGMAAHIVLKSLGDDKAVTISSKAINDIIRAEIGFNGFLVSDAIMMKALQGSISDKAEQSITAGCDAVCLGNADFNANIELCRSKILMSDKAQERLQRVLEIIKKKVQFTQYEQVKNKYCANLKNIITYDYNYDATEVLNHLRHNK